MAPKAVQLWELLLQQLNKLTVAEPAISANATEILIDEIQLWTGKLSALPRLPHNIWASLIQKQQVPQRVIDTCHRLSKQLSITSTPPSLSTDCYSSSAASSHPAGPTTEQLDGLVTNLLLTLTSALLDLPPGPNSNTLLLTVQQQLAQPRTLDLLTALFKRSSTACAELVAQAYAAREGWCFSSSSSGSRGSGSSSSSGTGTSVLVGGRTAGEGFLSMGRWPPAELVDESNDVNDSSSSSSSSSSSGSTNGSSIGSSTKSLDLQLAVVSGQFCMLAVTASMMQAYFDRDTQLKASSAYKACLSAVLTATEQAMRAAWTCAVCVKAADTQQGALLAADQAQPARKVFMAGYKLTLQLLAQVGRTTDSTTAADAAADAAPMHSQQEDDQQLRLLTSMILTTVVSLTFPSQPASSSCSSTLNTANASQQQQQQQQYIKSTAWLNPLADLTGCYTANIFWAAQILTDQIRWEFRMQNMTDLVSTYTRLEQEKTAAGQPVTYIWNRFTLFLPTLLFDWAASCRSLASSRTDYAQVVGCAAQGALTSFLQCSVAACLLGVRKAHSGSSSSSGTADWSAPVLHPLLHVFQQPTVVIVRSLEWELGKVNNGLKRPITEMLQALLAQLKADMRSYRPVKTDSSLSCSLSSNSSGGRDSTSSSSGGGRGGDSTGSSSGGRRGSSDSGSSLSGDLLVQRSAADRIASTLDVLRLLLRFTEALLCSTDSLEAAQVHNPRHAQHLSAAAEKYPLAVQCFKTLDAIARLSIYNASTSRIEASFPAVGDGSGSLLLWDCTGPAGQQGDSSAAEVWVPSVPGPLLKHALAAGPGSAEQRKLISCCCSLTKVVQRQVVSPTVPLGGPRGSAPSGTGLRAGSVQPAGSCTWSNLEGAWSTLLLAARSVVAILDAGTAALREQCGGNSSSSSSRGSSSGSSSDQGSTSDGGSSSENGSSASWATDEVHHSTCSNYGNSSIDGAAKEKHPCSCKPQGWPCPPVSCSWADFPGNCHTGPVFQQFGNASAYAAAHELQPDAMAAAATMTALLPCLAVLGRCCLLWSGMVPALMQDVLRSALTLSASQNPALDSATNSTVQSALEARVAARDHITAMEQQILQVQALLGDVLVACGMPLPAGPPALLQGQASLLSAAGIRAVDDVVLQASLQQAHTSLGAAAAAVQELSEADLMMSGSVHVQAKALLDIRRRVQKDLEVLVRCFGRAVIVTNLCNNYLCSNLQGLSEGGIVKGRGHMCSGCRTARYCSRECQEQHWELHKGACGELKKRGGAHGMSSRSDGCSDSSSLGDS